MQTLMHSWLICSVIANYEDQSIKNVLPEQRALLSVEHLEFIACI